MCVNRSWSAACPAVALVGFRSSPTVGGSPGWPGAAYAASSPVSSGRMSWATEMPVSF